LRQIYQSSTLEDNHCQNFKNDHIERELKDETLRHSLIDPIYEETRGMIIDYLDISNLVRRLEALVGTKDAKNSLSENRQPHQSQRDKVNRIIEWARKHRVLAPIIILGIIIIGIGTVVTNIDGIITFLRKYTSIIQSTNDIPKESN